MSSKIICYFEIMLLISSSFTFAYFMSDFYPQENNFFNLMVNFFKKWYSLSKINIASAESLQCCLNLKSGASCENTLSSQCSQLCNENCQPTSCSEISECSIGCCIDSDEGLCQNSVNKKTCENAGGLWKNDANCNLAECVKACCVLGSQTNFVTETRCRKLSNLTGNNFNFKQNIQNELECLSLSNSQDEGACKIEDSCKFVTKEKCLALTKNPANFYKDYLCSNPEINSTCIKQKTKSCIEGKDEVYWIDSCGNKENIYDTNKEKSWNNGKVLKKEESCNTADNSCGNCNYIEGTKCNKGSCEDLNCDNAVNLMDAFGKVIQKKDRKNGESWCVYDGAIGNGKDIVGSRHYKFYCIDGEVKSEPCGDYRTGICVEEKISLSSKSQSFASCRPNRALECIGYNSNEENMDSNGKVDKEKLQEECQKNSDCEIRKFDFGKKYQFSVCSPKYPIGFNRDENVESAEAICNIADITCIKVKVKTLTGWKTVSGDDCDSKEFTQAMNDYCISLGDCGGNVNIAGETSKSYKVKNAPSINIDQYKKNINPNSYKAEVGNISEILFTQYGWGSANYSSAKSQLDILKEQQNSLKKIIGGSLMLVPSPFIVLGLSLVLFSSVGLILTKAFGVTDPSTAILIGGLASAAVLGTTVGALASTGVGIIVAVIIVAIAAVIYGVLKIIGYGKVKKKVVTFNCEMWQAKTGGNDCKKCSENELKPCTEYKCESLGQACELSNEGTINEICEYTQNDDISPPIIKENKEILTTGYKYFDISENGFKLYSENRGCIPEFTPVIFGITTNELSQCNIDIEHTSDFEEMEDTFGVNAFTYNHSTTFYMPSVDSILAGVKEEMSEKEFLNLNELTKKKYGNFTLYVRCKDRNGNKNIQEYSIQTCISTKDISAPTVVKAVPENNAFISLTKNISVSKLYLNEPAECRYAMTDKDYREMNLTFDCNTDVEDVSLYGWECSGNLTTNNIGENSYYVKCRDQPWLGENESRNIGSYKYTLTKTLKKLEIVNVEPKNIIIAGTEPATITLKATTLEGSESGRAKCMFSFNNKDFIEMKNTNSVSHSQVFSLNAGLYKISLKCSDNAENEAVGESNFEVKIDKAFPKVVRVYNSAGLKIITNEDSECSYSFSSCNFDWNNATRMIGIQKIHTTDIQDKIYFVKCRDIWGNMPDDCSITVMNGKT